MSVYDIVILTDYLFWISNMLRSFITAVLLIIIAGINTYAVNTNICTGGSNSITVAGFINLGDSKDKFINTELTKSLINYLKLHTEVRITGYMDVRSYARNLGFWDNGILNVDNAMKIAENFGAGVLITGDYMVDDSDSSVVVKVCIYDDYRRRLITDINYNGLTGINLIDTIDAIDSDIAGLMSEKAAGPDRKLIRVQISSNSYNVYINGVNFSNTNSVTLSGPALFKSKVVSGFHYENCAPWVDIVLPGFAQIQSGDYWMGTLFSVTAGCCAGLTVLSIAGYNNIEQRYSQAVMDSEGPSYAANAAEWAGFMTGCIVVWAAWACLSTIQAYSLKAEADKSESNITLSIGCDPAKNNVTFSIVKRF